MSVAELCLSLLIFSAATAAGSAGLGAMVRSARLSAAAADLAAEIRENGALAALAGQTVALRFNPDSYDITVPGKIIKRRTLPRLLVLSEAKFGSGGKAGPQLNLGPNGVSSPGRVMLREQDGTGFCTVTRSLRGLTTTRCSYGR